LAIQRLIKYIPQGGANTENSIGAGSHVDFGAVTLLYQDSPGLEIWVEGEWRTVAVHTTGFVLNTGYLLEKLTNFITYIQAYFTP